MANENKENKVNKSLYDKLTWIFNCVVLIPLLSVMMIICFVLLTSKLNNSLPTILDNHIVRIVSESMEPELKRGDIVLVAKTSSEDLEVGDIIAYYRHPENKSSSTIWFHRIIEITTDEDGYLWFKTKGDANKLPDIKLVREDHIIGIYNTNAAWIHHLLALAISRTGIILFIIIPSGLIIMGEGLYLINLLSQKERKSKASKDKFPPVIAMEETSEVLPLKQSKNQTQVIKTITVKNPKGKALDLDQILANVEILKTKRRLTAKMIMKEAVKLEKIKNKMRYQEENQDKRRIHKTLNWCYEKIGNIKYENKKNEGKTKNEKN